jgi:zinc-dependent metalloproteinase lipoprotein
MIKNKVLFLFFIALAFFGCKSSDNAPILEVSQTSLTDVSADGETRSVGLSATGTWTATTSSDWCTVSPTSGESDATLQVKVNANTAWAAREDSIVVTMGDQKKKISIAQEVKTDVDDNYTYEIPLNIILLEYQGKTLASDARIKIIINQMNQCYKNNNTNIQFTIGNISHNSVSQSSIDSEKEIQADKRGGTYFKMMKDPNLYINLFIHNMPATSNLAGVSAFPILTETQLIDCNNYFNVTDTYPITFDQINQVRAICFNADLLPLDPPDQDAMSWTMAHEIGHYLGLFHVFSEAKNTCKDTDCCTDTYSYDKKIYDTWLKEQRTSGVTDDTALSARTSCDGVEYTAKNFMDYSWCLNTEFTAQQLARMRHILYYSPLIPGPKKPQTTSRAAEGWNYSKPFKYVVDYLRNK